jgi:ABC-type phosphonate transport system ATPase subunit
VAARADHQQVGPLLLGLAVQTGARARRHHAHQLRLHVGLRALALEQLERGLALVRQQTRDGGVQRVQLAGTHVGERQFSLGPRQQGGERDRVASVTTTVDTSQHVLEHLVPP